MEGEGHVGGQAVVQEHGHVTEAYVQMVEVVHVDLRHYAINSGPAIRVANIANLPFNQRANCQKQS